MNSKLITLLLSAFLFFGRVDAGSGMSIEVELPSGGQRHDPTVSVHVQDRNGRKHGGPVYGPNRNEGGRSTLFPEAKPAPSETPEQRTRREAQARQAAEKFTGWSAETAYDMLTVNGNEYCRARNNAEEFLSLSVGRGWSKTSRDLIGRQTFANQPCNLIFETTPYMWFFDKVTIGGKRYDHAWSDSLLDFLVPEGERHTICAPADFVKQFSLEKELERQRKAAQTVQDQCIRALQGHAQPLANMYFEETQQGLFGSVFYANKWNFSDPNSAEVNVGRRLAQGAMEYYHSAIEIAETVHLGSAAEVATAFLIPGGVENLQAFADGSIDAVRFLTNIGTDLAVDLAAPEFKIAGKFIGSLKKASVKTAGVNFRKGVKGGSKLKTAEVKERKIDTQSDQLRFWDKLKESGEWKSVKGYGKPTLYNAKNERFSQKSREKWEIEVFNKNEDHIGVFKPSDGKFHPELAVKGRKMRK